jgi:hypothetical protein
LWDHGRLPSMKDNILELLHDFLNQFLSGGYNGICSEIKIISHKTFACFCFLLIILLTFIMNWIHVRFDGVDPWRYREGASCNSKQWHCCFLSGCSVCYFFSISQVYYFQGEIWGTCIYNCVFDRHSIFSDGFNFNRSLSL